MGSIEALRWRHGEKVVVFCHYRETGRALVKHLSAAMEKQLWTDAAQRSGLDQQSVRKAVTDFGARFDADGGMRHPLDRELVRRLECTRCQRKGRYHVRK
jgi:hypothetical protein